MKRIGYLYEQICDIDLIKCAIHNAARGKTHRYYVARVLNDIDKYAQEIQVMLQNETVNLTPGRQVTIYDKSCSKERLITVPKFFPDQIIHWAVMLILQPIIMKGAYRYTCGSIPGRGGMEAKKFVEKALQDKEVQYVAKLDISKFFQNVRPSILHSMVARKVKDKRLLNLVGMILENGGDCLPIGYYTSQWFSNFYLEQFDHYVKEVLRVRYYVRYVDDMVLLDTDKDKLHKVIVDMNTYLGTIGLKLKDNYQVWKIDSRPIDFVGFRFFTYKTEFRNKIYYRLMRRARKIKDTAHINIHQAQGMISLLGWLSHLTGHKELKAQVAELAPAPKLKYIVSRKAKEKQHGKQKCKPRPEQGV